MNMASLPITQENPQTNQPNVITPTPKPTEGFGDRPAVGSHVQTPLGAGVVKTQAFANTARVLLDETPTHMASLVDVPWNEVKAD
jgi:hypothetical protein